MNGFAERIAKLSPNRLALLAIDLNQKLESMQTAFREPIAIIGIGCRFPGDVKSPSDYWRLLYEGRDAVREVPADRWDTKHYYDPDPNAPGRMNTRWGALLRDVDRFDAEFFGIAPREAMNMDPQQRIVLETAWEALENAGQAPQGLEGSNTGVFIGASGNDYLTMLLNRDVEVYDAYVASGGAHSVISGRLSYFLGLRGPSLSIDTACSSSLAAIHLACQSLRNHECRLALAGGVNLVLTPAGTVALSKVNMMAPDGRCKAFDESANGFVRGEGCGIVVIKRLADAKADGDTVLALIRGSAVNQDGRSNGLTAPNGPAQEAVIRTALNNAGVDPQDVDYVEAHGTGTSLGDPIEAQALGTVFKEGHSKKNPLWIGSVKTNIGHLEAAAGVAGLIKVVLSLQNKSIPPHLHLKNRSSFIPWEELPVDVPLVATDWNSKRRIAGVSSFGFSGTNAHVILEEAPPVDERSTDLHDRPLHLCCLSAKNQAALKDLAKCWAEHISDNRLPLADICHTANVGRTHFPHRLCIPVDSLESLLGGLDGFSGAAAPDNCLYKRCDAENPPKIAFLFTGQGAQYPGMGKELFETQPIFREELERCDALLRSYLDKPLLGVMYPEDPACVLVHQTQYAQPALLAFEYAMATLWQSWGVKPSAVMGHSIGEYTAACLSGVITLEDALRLVAERGKLIQSLPQEGAMAAVFASEAQVRRVLNGYEGQVDIAAVNGPESFVISGNRDTVKAIQNELEAQGIKSKNLQVSHAFHSPLMEPILRPFERIAESTQFSPPCMDIVSNLSGKMAESGDLTETSYWMRHLRRPVQFRQSIQTLIDEGYRVFVEIGPSPKLIAMAQIFISDSKTMWLPSIRRGKGNWQQILESLARLYIEGVEIDWTSFDKSYPRAKVSLPTYPFRKNRYWLETKTQNRFSDGNASPVGSGTGNHLENSAAVEKNELSDWLYEIQWQPITDIQKPNLEYAKPVTIASQATETVKRVAFQPPTEPTQDEKWLIVSHDGEIGFALQQEIEAGGGKVWTASPLGDETRNRRFDFVLNPYRPDEFIRILQQIQSDSRTGIRGVIFTAPSNDCIRKIESLEELESETYPSCRSLLWILQAMLQTANGSTPKLWVVTQGCQPVVENDSPLRISCSPLWGLGRTVEMEHPELWGGLIDWQDPNCAEAAKQIWSEIRASSEETQIAFYGGQRYAARLIRTRSPISLSTSLPIQSDATYLITGGTGGIGLKTARWMVEQGARNLVLVSRRGASADTEAELQALRKIGAQVDAVKMDVTSEKDVKRLLESIEETLPPLKGIFHIAGTIHDRVLSRMDWNEFQEVLAPKMKGAWLLHRHTINRPLDFFVMFSSAASFLGPAGQGNYAAANAFLDSLAQERRRCGLSAVSINWGPWEKVGMAATVGERRESQWSQAGFVPMRAQEGFGILGGLLQSAPVQVAVLPVKWPAYFDRFSDRSIPRFYEMLARESLAHKPEPTTETLTFLQQLMTAPLPQRWNRLAEHVYNQAVYVLGFPRGHAIEPQQGFFEIGMDSLTSIELKNRLQNSLGKALPSTVIFDYPCIEDLTKYLADEVLNWTTASLSSVPNDVSSSSGRWVERSEATEEELETLLAAKLASI